MPIVYCQLGLDNMVDSTGKLITRDVYALNSTHWFVKYYKYVSEYKNKCIFPIQPNKIIACGLTMCMILYRWLKDLKTSSYSEYDIKIIPYPYSTLIGLSKQFHNSIDKFPGAFSTRV